MLSLLSKAVGAVAVVAGALAVGTLGAGAQAPPSEWPTFYDSHGWVGVQLPSTWSAVAPNGSNGPLLDVIDGGGVAWMTAQRSPVTGSTSSAAAFRYFTGLIGRNVRTGLLSLDPKASVHTDVVMLPSGRAVRTTAVYVFPTLHARVRTVFYDLLQSDAYYQLEYTSLASKRRSYAGVFETSARSIRVRPRTATAGAGRDAAQVAASAGAASAASYPIAGEGASVTVPGSWVLVDPKKLARFMHSAAFRARFHASPLSASLSAKVGKVLRLMAYEPPGPPHPMLEVVADPTADLGRDLAKHLEGVVSVHEEQTRVVTGAGGRYVRTTFSGSVPASNGKATVEQGIAYDFVHGSRELLIYVFWPRGTEHAARYAATADAIANALRFD
jgi:hypothetical protein